MEAIIAILVGAASVAWWQRTRRKPVALEDFLDGDAQVAVHVAEHAQRSRAQTTFTTCHILYGLVQDDTIAAAIRASGGDPAAFEDRVLATLDAPADHQRAITADAQELLARAVGSAYHQQRKVSRTDLWAYLLAADVGAVFAAAKVDALAVLHILVHGTPLPALPDGPGDVHVVIRNDDYTPQELVTHLLTQVFELPAAEATAKMMTAHTEGKAVLVRLPAVLAHAKIRQARELARSAHFPLWIAAEPT
ncbi:MAG: ATP-dependent Clp protease adaptor ClpS [Kofleriaceae bacterium]|nr:ATP-dependent Clp protease adaptor ClpS [Kofleriaceae bacterium]